MVSIFRIPSTLLVSRSTFWKSSLFSRRVDSLLIILLRGVVCSFIWIHMAVFLLLLRIWIVFLSTIVVVLTLISCVLRNTAAFCIVSLGRSVFYVGVWRLSWRIFLIVIRLITIVVLFLTVVMMVLLLIVVMSVFVSVSVGLFWQSLLALQAFASVCRPWLCVRRSSVRTLWTLMLFTTIIMLIIWLVIVGLFIIRIFLLVVIVLLRGWALVCVLVLAPRMSGLMVSMLLLSGSLGFIVLVVVIVAPLLLI